MEKIKKEKGITLVALIITIIVLLILAVFTIKTIGDDGILTYASDATESYKKEQVKEKVQLELNEYEMAKHTSEAMTLEEFLNDKYKDKVEKNASDGTFTILIDGYFVIIDANGYIVKVDSESKEDNNNCEHIWEEVDELYDLNKHKCSKCNYIETHTYEYGSCFKCEYICQHEYDYYLGTGVAPVPGSADEAWHTCGECGEPVAHKWSGANLEDGILNYGGYCMDCRYECLHNGEKEYGSVHAHKCLICGGYESHDGDAMPEGGYTCCTKNSDPWS